MGGGGRRREKKEKSEVGQSERGNERETGTRCGP